MPIFGCGDGRAGIYFNLTQTSDVVAAVNNGWNGIGDPGGSGITSRPYTTPNRGLDGNIQDLYVQNAYSQAGNKFWWLSFWTCDWPNQSIDTFGSAGQLAGNTAATYVQGTFGAYIPLYLIADLGETGNNNPRPSTAAQYQDYVNAFASAVTAVNSLFRPGFYCNQGDYQTFSLNSLNVPAFVAVSPILNNTPYVSGPNITGFIAYYASCPAGSYVGQVVSWNARWNTVQFSGSGMPCGPQ